MAFQDHSGSCWLRARAVTAFRGGSALQPTIKKILGAVRWLIFDHAYNTARPLGIYSRLGRQWHRWRTARTDSDGNPNVFNLERNEDGLWLNNNWAKPDNTWNPDNKFAFRLRNCFLFPQLQGLRFFFSGLFKLCCLLLLALKTLLRSAD